MKVQISNKQRFAETNSSILHHFMLNDKQQKLFDSAMKSEVLCFFAVAQPLVDQLCEIIRLKEAEVQELKKQQQESK